MESVILSEDFAGLRAQALGLAERAGLAPTERVVGKRRLWQRLPHGPWPPLIIGCGGAAARVGARLRQAGRQVVQVQHPRMDPARFDLIVAARHDDLTGANVVVTRTALHRATPLVLAAAAERWRTTFAHLPHPLVAVLVGGSNGRFRLDQRTGAALAAQLAAMMRLDGVGIAITPSRRTPAGVVDALRAALVPLGGWIWDGAGDNPYFGLLALADAIIVTIDSVSMISEAVATAAPVLIAALPGRSRRIARFTQGLMAEGRVRPYAGRLESWATAPLDDTDMAAAAMRTRLGW